MGLCFQASVRGPLQVLRREPGFLFYGCRFASKPAQNTVQACSLPKPALIFVTPNGFSQSYSRALRTTKDALAGGTSLVQVRDRHATTTELLNVTETLLSAGIPPSKLSINGLHPSEVLGLSCELGVHIREADIGEISTPARTLLPSNVIVGCSVHSVDSARRAMTLLAPAYIQVGTMFSTGSHPGKIPEGPALLRAIRQEVGTEQMLVGIGGIDRDNLAAVFENGGSGIAVISSISASQDAFGAASELLRICNESFGEILASSA